MTHFRSGKTDLILQIILFSLLGASIVFYLLWAQSTWGVAKGTALAFVWIFLATALILSAIFKPHLIMIAFAASTPFLLRLNITRFSISISGISYHAFYFAEIALLFVLVMKYFSSRYDEKGYNNKSFSSFILWYSCAMMIAGGIISTLLAPNIMNGNIAVAGYSFLGQIVIPLLLFLFVYLIIDARHVEIIYSFMFFGFVLNAFIGLGTFFSGFKMSDFLLTRLSYNFVGPNTYAAVTMLFVPAGLILTMRQNRLLPRLLYFVLSLILMGSVFSTISRGGILSLFFTLAVLFMLEKKARKEIGKVIGVFFVMLVIATPFIINVFLRFQGILSRSRIAEISTLTRLSAWDASIKAIFIYPFGIGGNQFPALYSAIGRFPDIPVLHSHHMFLGTAVEYGIIALLGLILFLGIIFFKAFTTIKNMGQTIERETVSAITAGISGFVFMSIVSEGPRCHLNSLGNMYNDGLIFFFIILALLYKLISSGNYEKS